MVGVLIYKSASQQYYSFVSFDDDSYSVERREIPKRGDQILWERGNVSLAQIENARKTKDDLVKKLNEGQEVNLEKELEEFFE